MIHDKIHINSLKQKYLAEYLVPDSQAYRYIYKKLNNELQDELGINDLHESYLDYKFNTLKSSCELCEHYYNKREIIKQNYTLIEMPDRCLIDHYYREKECSLYKLSEEKYKRWVDNEIQLRKLIHSVIGKHHVELYILIKIAQRKLVKYKKQKNETS